jgi:tetratricopeptide (TPR) repeat protein
LLIFVLLFLLPGGAPQAAALPGDERAKESPASLQKPQEPIPDLGIWYAGFRKELRLRSDAPSKSKKLTESALDFIALKRDKDYGKIKKEIERIIAREGKEKLVFAIEKTDPSAARKFAEEALQRRQSEPRRREDEITLFTLAALSNPSDPFPLTQLAILHNENKDFKTGLRFSLLAVAVEPQFISPYHEAAYALKNLSRYDEVIRFADRGLAIKGADLHVKALLLARKGQAYWMKKNEPKALDAFMASRRLGGPAWVASYLEGKQKLGKPFRE